MLDIFLPTFFKTLAIILGIGGGVLITALTTFIILLAIYPITRRFNK